MGRPERAISSDNDPVNRLAADLRMLRRQAGSPTYRDMAAKVHFSASALSQAANGQRLPTLPVFEAFVAACEGDHDEWTRRWEEAAASPSATPTSAAREDPPPPRVPEKHRRPWWRGRTVLAAVAAGILVGGLVIALDRKPGRPSPLVAQTLAGPSASEGQTVDMQGQPVADGSDPKRSGCADDAVTIDSVSLVFPAQRLAGTVELRYSPRCKAGWSRFVPAPHSGRGLDDTVTVVISRPSTAVRLPFTISYGDGAVYGDILLTTSGCVTAAASIVTHGKQSGEFRTACRSGP